ncbi:MAG: SPOR domain-containing protein [Bacteroidales bacterium]
MRRLSFIIVVVFLSIMIIGCGLSRMKSSSFNRRASSRKEILNPNASVDPYSFRMEGSKSIKSNDLITILGLSNGRPIASRTDYERNEDIKDTLGTGSKMPQEEHDYGVNIPDIPRGYYPEGASFQTWTSNSDTKGEKEYTYDNHYAEIRQSPSSVEKKNKVSKKGDRVLRFSNTSGSTMSLSDVLASEPQSRPAKSQVAVSQPAVSQYGNTQSIKTKKADGEQVVAPSKTKPVPQYRSQYPGYSGSQSSGSTSSTSNSYNIPARPSISSQYGSQTPSNPGSIASGGSVARSNSQSRPAKSQVAVSQPAVSQYGNTQSIKTKKADGEQVVAPSKAKPVPQYRSQYPGYSGSQSSGSTSSTSNSYNIPARPSISSQYGSQTPSNSGSIASGGSVARHNSQSRPANMTSDKSIPTVVENGYYVVIGSFRSASEARSWAQRLIKQQFKPFIVANDAERRYRVCTNRYDTEQEARHMAKMISQLYPAYSDAWVLRNE